MNYKYFYQTPSQFSNIIMTGNKKYLTGLYFEYSNDSSKHTLEYEIKELPIFKDTSFWLDNYFNGKIPSFTPTYKLYNLTPFRNEVTDIMNTIEYGKLITYNDIAKEIAKNRGISKMSAQAVGGAVGKNPICIIIPCHRVIGSNGNLIGYGGGMKNKVELLKLEGIDISKYSIPTKGTKL